MILTVTLNPAVDKTYQAEKLILGQVNRMRSSISLAGGKGINVAKILRQFNHPVMTTGFLGGYSGNMIEELMIKMGADCRFTRIAEETRTSTNIISDSGQVTEILEPGPLVSKEEQECFLDEFTHCLTRCRLVALCGSVPSGIPIDFYRNLIEKCYAEGKKVILDTSGDLLKEAIKTAPYPYIIKPNIQEMESLVGRKLESPEEVEEAAYELIGLGIEKVVVSLGAQGLCYIDRECSIYKPALKIKAVNTVGCGDSVVASLCMSELAGDTPAETVKKAVVLSAANATTMESAHISLNLYNEFLKN